MSIETSERLTPAQRESLHIIDDLEKQITFNDLQDEDESLKLLIIITKVTSKLLMMIDLADDLRMRVKNVLSSE